MKDRQLIFTSDVTSNFFHFCSAHEQEVSMGVAVSLGKAKINKSYCFCFPFFFLLYCFLILFNFLLFFFLYSYRISRIFTLLLFLFSFYWLFFLGNCLLSLHPPPCPLKYFHFPPNTCPFSLLPPFQMKHV